MKKEIIIPLFGAIFLLLLLSVGIMAVQKSTIREKELELERIEQEEVLEAKYQEGLEQGKEDLILNIGEQLRTTGYYKLPVTMEDGSEKFLPLVIYNLLKEE